LFLHQRRKSHFSFQRNREGRSRKLRDGWAEADHTYVCLEKEEEGAAEAMTEEEEEAEDGERLLRKIM
jgi:hypothetical protein